VNEHKGIFLETVLWDPGCSKTSFWYFRSELRSPNDQTVLHTELTNFSSSQWLLNRSNSRIWIDVRPWKGSWESSEKKSLYSLYFYNVQIFPVIRPNKWCSRINFACWLGEKIRLVYQKTLNKSFDQLFYAITYKSQLSISPIPLQPLEIRDPRVLYPVSPSRFPKSKLFWRSLIHHFNSPLMSQPLLSPSLYTNPALFTAFSSKLS